MAGAGYKLFTTGSVLTAADVNTYLNEQTVMVFASAAARTSALSSVLAEGMVSYLKDTNATEVYDGSAWVGIGNSGDITGVTAGTGISGGGTSGTVTITNDMATTITAAGDIVVGTGSGTYDNLPIGTTGQVLTADTTVSPYKVKWASASSSPSFVGCAAYKNASAQSLSNNTDTAITLDAEEFDTDGFHSTSSNTSRMTIPTGKGGKYLLTGNIQYAGNNTGVRAIRFTKNGAGVGGYVYVAANSVTAESTFLNCAQIVEGSAGDYFELYGYQGSGGALNVNANQAGTRFSIQFLGA